MPSKYGCFNASKAVNRWDGYIIRRDLIKLSPFLLILPIYLFYMLSRDEISGNFIPRNLWFFRNIYLWSGVKGPKHFWIKKSWSSSLSPGNIGIPSINYPKIQPNAHISTYLEYDAPTNN